MTTSLHDSCAVDLPKKKWLVYSSIGPAAKVAGWMQKGNGVDFAVCRYHDSSPEVPFARFQLRHSSLKFPNFFAMYDRWPAIADYDYVLFADDDIEISASQVLTFMHRVEELALDLAQPALTADSDVSWLHLVHKSGLDAEPTLFVEIQFFAMSKRLFDLALPYFRQGHSGFGMDVVLARLGRRHRLTAAVIHSVQMRHPPRPKSETVHADSELRATNDRLIEDIYRQLGRHPTLDHFQYISAKVRKLTPAVLLATAPFYGLRFLLLQVLRMLGLRRH